MATDRSVNAYRGQDAVLNRSLLCYLSDEPYLHRVTDKLLASDILLVRDLLAMTKAQLKSAAKLTPQNEKRLIAKLERDGFNLSNKS